MKTLNHFIAIILLLAVVNGVFAQGFELAAVNNPPEKADISKSITLYPNPSVDFVQVKLGLLNAHQAKLTLHNILGNELPIETEVMDDHEVRVRVKDLPSGYYLLAIRDEHTSFRGTYKFLKR